MVPATAPELSTWAMLLIGFAGLTFTGLSRGKKALRYACVATATMAARELNSLAGGH